MTKHIYYRVTPLEPLIARDSRPFGEGGRAGVLEWLTPSLIAGALRTFLWEHGAQDASVLKRVAVSGGFPVYDERIYFPRPADILMGKTPDAQERRIYQIRPIKIADGVIYDLPEADKGFIPSLAKDAPDDGFKPDSMASWWQSALLERWLDEGEQGAVAVTQDDFKEPATLSPASKDIRVHVSVDPDTLTAAEGKLFSTTGLDLNRRARQSDDDDEKQGRGKLGPTVQLSIRVDYDAEGLSDDVVKYLPIEFLLPLGGDRRAARFEQADDAALWGAYAKPNMQIDDQNHLLLRMVLATPAIFKGGWLPGWLSDGLCGKFPGTEIELKLVSAIVNRWDPVSGWDYVVGKPKPLRRMAPAGSVYFFEVVADPKHQLREGNTETGAFDFSELWLRSCCDDEQDRRDGFGLTLWGTWFDSRDRDNVEKENK